MWTQENAETTRQRDLGDTGLWAPERFVVIPSPFLILRVYRGVGCANPITPFLDVRRLPVNWAYLHPFPMNTRKWDIQSH